MRFPVAVVLLVLYASRLRLSNASGLVSKTDIDASSLDVHPYYEACSYIGRADEKSFCEAQCLNITDPPSIYSFVNYPGIWATNLCYLMNVTLSNRVDQVALMNYCTVPARGFDSFIFVSLALLATSLLFGKLATAYVLLTGAVLGVLNYFVDLKEVGNGISIWLSFRPGDVFLYAFLPPLIVEQAMFIDLYMFRKMFVHSIMLAVVMVILTTIILTPLILFVLGFNNSGWTWVYGAIFAAIIAPTDALAVSSMLKKANGPAVLQSILEGESLLNDATGITLFQIFIDIIIETVDSGDNTWPSVWSVIPTIIVDIIKLTAIGVGIGLGFSIVSFYILRWLRWRGAGLHIEATYVLALAYMTYYVTNSPAGGSGVIAVVTFGLFGNYLSLWGMTGSAVKTGEFKTIWETISFMANGIVFFWAGLASLNFLMRSIVNQPKPAIVYASIPIIYAFMLIIRTFCVALFNPIFHLAGRALSIAEIAFVGWSGLRGAVSLILLSYVASGRIYLKIDGEERNDVLESGMMAGSDMTLWTSCFVVLTLLINGPTIGPLLSTLGLNTIPKATLGIQGRVKKHILNHILNVLKKLREGDGDDDFLQGADWEIVGKYVDLSNSLSSFGQTQKYKTTDDSGKERKKFDENSIVSVSKAFVVAIWRMIKTFANDLFRLKFVFRDSSDAYEPEEYVDSSSKHPEDLEEREHDKAGEDNSMERMMSECIFQTSDAHRATATSHHASASLQTDVEVGVRPSENMNLSLEKASYFSRVSQKGSFESDVKQVCLMGERGPLLFGKQPEGEMKGPQGDSKLSETTDHHEININLMLSSLSENLGQFYQNTFGESKENKFGTGNIADAPQEDVNDQPPRAGDAYYSLDSSSEVTLSSKLLGHQNSEPGYEAEMDLFENRRSGEDLQIEHNAILLSDASTPGIISKKFSYKNKKMNCRPIDSNDKHEALTGGSPGKSAAGSTVTDSFGRLGSQNILDVIGLHDSEDDKDLVEYDTVNHSENQLDQVLLQEIRARLVGGLLKQFQLRREQGTLSIQAFHLLEGVCNEDLETNHAKISLWDKLSHKIGPDVLTSLISQISYTSSKAYKSMPIWLRRVCKVPLAIIGKLSRYVLGKKMLIACEVAIEYNLAWVSNAYVQWLKLHGDRFIQLLNEVDGELECTYKFINDREIEAPDTFRAIQSYRASLTVLEQAQKYIRYLNCTGILKNNEYEVIVEKISKKIRRLEIVGPIWRPPQYKDFVRSLTPFSSMSRSEFRRIWDMGNVKEFKPGDVIFQTDSTNPKYDGGIIYVISGVCKRTRSQGLNKVESFCGAGSSLGLLQALQLSSLEGSEVVEAVGNALDRATVVFAISQSNIESILSDIVSENSEPSLMMQLVEGWIKSASLFIFAELESSVAGQIFHILKGRIGDDLDVNSIYTGEHYYRKTAFMSPFVAQRSTGTSMDEEVIDLEQVFSSEIAPSQSTYRTKSEDRVEFLKRKSREVARALYLRLKRKLDQTAILQLKKGDIFTQSTTMVLLSGTLKLVTPDAAQSQEYQSLETAKVIAPSVIVWVGDELATSLRSPRKGDQGTAQEICWQVCSPQVLVVL